MDNQNEQNTNPQEPFGPTDGQQYNPPGPDGANQYGHTGPQGGSNPQGGGGYNPQGGPQGGNGYNPQGGPHSQGNHWQQNGQPYGAPGGYMDNDALQAKNISWIAYLWILFFVPLLTNPGNRFAKFHANQGLILLIAGAAVRILRWIFRYIFWVFYWPFSILFWGIDIALFVLSIIGIVGAIQGQYKEIPILGKIKIIK